jgi:hypothetical protein
MDMKELSCNKIRKDAARYDGRLEKRIGRK